MKAKLAMQLTDEVCFEIYFGKVGEIKFHKNHSKIFLTELSDNYFPAFT